MGFIKAFSGAIGGTFADQWKDFLTVPSGLPPTAAIFPAVPQGQNNGRGANVSGSTGIISNGSKIVVPEGYGLVTFDNGALTGFVAEPGGFEWRSDDQNSASIFAGDGIISPLIKTSWERFKFGGQPGAQQLALFVNLKEIPNNRFGTQSEIYWDDAFLGTQVGALARGVYSMRIVDPVLFLKNFVPATYLTGEGIFDFNDFNNPVSEQLFTEVIGSLAPAFSNYTNDPSKGNRMAKIQSDSVGFAQSLSGAVEANYGWSTSRGLSIVNVAIASIEYDADTTQLLSDVKKADALSGNRGASFLQQSVARGFEAAGQNGGSGGMAMMGMGVGMTGQALNFQQQQPAPTQGVPVAQPAPAPATTVTPNSDQPVVEKTSMVDKLIEYKQLLDAGVLTQEEFDALKLKALGL